jgi:hypothetical protein
MGLDACIGCLCFRFSHRALLKWVLRRLTIELSGATYKDFQTPCPGAVCRGGPPELPPSGPSGAIGILSRRLPRLRVAFPRARLRVRLDGGFATAEMFAFLEREGLEYVVAMGKNKVLQRRAARLMGTARRLSRASGETEHLHGETRYAAGTWDQQRRRVIIKAEVVRHPGREPKDNPRFVVTNLRHSPRHLYESIYCARGLGSSRPPPPPPRTDDTAQTIRSAAAIRTSSANLMRTRPRSATPIRTKGRLNFRRDLIEWTASDDQSTPLRSARAEGVLVAHR